MEEQDVGAGGMDTRLEKGIGAGGRIRRSTQYAQPVVESDHEDLTPRGEHPAVVQVAAAPVVGLAVHEHHDGQRPAGLAPLRQVDVEVEAVLGLAG